MELQKKLLSLLPNLAFVENNLSECQTELYVIRKAYSTAYNVESEEKNARLVRELILVRALRDRLWETINTGPYANVRIVDRQAYTITTALQVALICTHGNDIEMERVVVEECIRDLDYGLLLGYPLSEPHSNLLTQYMNELQNLLRPDNSSDTIISFMSDAKRSTNEVSSIEILDRPSIEHFHMQYFAKRVPAIITNCMDQWPAMTKWPQPTYLIDVAGERMVPIEIGSHYTNDDWAQDMVKLKDFLRRQFANDDSDEIEYLAQHNLFDQIPQLQADLPMPEYCCITENDAQAISVDTKIWLGPKGTISPMHHDPKHNLLSQIFGHKRIILAAPYATPHLYPHENDMLANTSQVDAEHLDFVRFPLTSNVKFYELTLYRGEMLYIPPKWWHYVRSLEKSLSVSFWWE